MLFERPVYFPIAIRFRERFEPLGINSSYRSGHDRERAPTADGAAAARLCTNLVRADLMSFGEKLCPDKQDYQCRPQHRSNEDHKLRQIRLGLPTCGAAAPTIRQR